jgi:short-subunit dehydrogenase
MKERKKVILLTGASVGLGLEVAKMLIAENQYHLFLTARPSSISRFKDEGIFDSEFIHLRELDVTYNNMREDLVYEICENYGGVDVLINNAGFTYRSVVEHVTESERLVQMETNFRAPMELIRLCLPKMRERRSGKIINISSVGGQIAMPTMGVYSASKHALEGSSESLWYEVRPWNIKVSLIAPGFINSKGFEKVKKTPLGERSSQDSHTAYYAHYHYMEDFIQKIMKLTPSTSTSVAKKVLKVIHAKNPPLRISGTWDATLFGLFRKFVPQRIYHLILYYSLPHIREWGRASKD